MAWEDRLTRFAVIMLALATAYGIVVGAIITMYYDVTPNMGSLEDNLAPLQAILYLIAFISSLAHLPLALLDARNGRWRQAFIRACVTIGPFIIFIGTEGLISHYLWWQPISDTDQFHMLHHSLSTGAPLTLAFWLAVRQWWRPGALISPKPYSSRALVMVGGITLLVVVALGLIIAVMIGLIPMPTA